MKELGSLRSYAASGFHWLGAILVGETRGVVEVHMGRLREILDPLQRVFHARNDIVSAPIRRAIRHLG